MQSIRKLFAAMAVALFAMAFLAVNAQACSNTGAAQVFLPWGDSSSYVLAPDGGFESGGAGWTLSGGAKTVEGNEPFYLHSAGDSRSLSLPAGGSAVSPAICMAIDTPTVRLVARNTGDTSSGLRVEATYSLLGLLHTKDISTVYSGAAWAPSQQMSTVLSLSTVVGTLTPSSIQIRITPLGGGGRWRIDDLYVDPFARH